MNAIFAAVLLLYPRGFRVRFGDAMTVAFREQVATCRTNRGSVAASLLAVRSLISTGMSGLAERRAAWQRARAGRTRTFIFRNLRQDVTFAFRMMRRQPGVTTLSIASLALGIGASTGAFSLVDASLLRALPLPAPDRLVLVLETIKSQTSQVSYDNLRDLQRLTRSFDALSAFRGQTVNVTGLPEPGPVRGGFVSSEFFTVAGVVPAHGRPLQPGDDLAGAPPVVVINHSVWQRLFGGAPDIVGRTTTLNNVAFTIVGVMPATFAFPVDGAAVWIPVRFYPSALNRSSRNLSVVGRLRPGVELSAAQSELDGVMATLAREYPTNADRGGRVVSMHDWLTSDSRSQLQMVFLLAIVLLAAACANVSSLQIGATMRRRQEIGVRVALGAGRGRIARQLVTEHLLLAGIAGVIGIGLTRVIVVLIGDSPLQVFRLEQATVDTRVLLFAAIATVTAGFVSACGPALHWAGRKPADQLRGAARSTGDRQLARVRALLVAGQVGMAALLLTTTVFLVKTAIATDAIDPGFQAGHVQSLEYRLPANKYADARQQVLFHDAVVERAAAVPGVRRAAVARGLPLSGNGDQIGIRLESMAAGEYRVAWLNTVSDDYFKVLGIPMIEGRTFDRKDDAGAPLVTVVSQAFANRMWPGQSAIGQEFEVRGFPVRPRVIGVVGDVRQFRLLDDVQPAFYARHAQNPGIFMTLLVETEGDPAAVQLGLRRAVWDVDRDQPLWKERSLQSLLDGSLAQGRYLSGALGVLASAAVVLVIAGLYGVVSQSVTARTREIGIRMVLGAGQWTVARQILRAGIVMTIGGLIPGLGAAVLVSRGMQSFLYGSSPLDPAPYIVATGLLIMIGLAACYVPARQATAVDPARAIRD